MSSEILIAIVFYSIICALFCRKLAQAKNLDEDKWFFAGILTGILALVAIAGMPVQQIEEDETAEGDASLSEDDTNE